jgi:hypothetical protein
LPSINNEEEQLELLEEEEVAEEEALADVRFRSKGKAGR